MDKCMEQRHLRKFYRSINMRLMELPQDFLVTGGRHAEMAISYQHADRHAGTFPHLLSLRVFKDKGHMTICIFLVPTSDQQ